MKTSSWNFHPHNINQWKHRYLDHMTPDNQNHGWLRWNFEKKQQLNMSNEDKRKEICHRCISVFGFPKGSKEDDVVKAITGAQRAVLIPDPSAKGENESGSKWVVLLPDERCGFQTLSLYYGLLYFLNFIFLGMSPHKTKNILLLSVWNFEFPLIIMYRIIWL